MTSLNPSTDAPGTARAHLRFTSSTAALCGRRVKTRRVHKDWPLCKTCGRIARSRGLGWVATFDNYGWSIPPMFTSSSSTGANYTLKWVNGRAA